MKKRYGCSTALEIPIRDDTPTSKGVPLFPGAWIENGPESSDAPLCASVMPRALQKFPGPRRIDAGGAFFNTPRFLRMMSIPSTVSAARSSTACGGLSPQTMLAQK
jgi:hypothetical protein